MGWTKLVFILITYLTAVACIDEFRYSREASLSGKIPSNNSSISVRSRNHCATICSLTGECRGFYYSDTLHECFLELSVTFTNFQDDVLGVYFTKIVPVVTTSPAPTTASTTPPAPTTVSSTPCPSTFMEVVHLAGTSGSDYTLKFFNVSVSQGDAVAMCNLHGSKLLLLEDDDSKIADLTSFLVSCPVYNLHGYWSDAELRTTEDGTPWKNSAGDIIGITHWCGGVTGNSASQSCARFAQLCSYKLKDKSCGSLYAVICE